MPPLQFAEHLRNGRRFSEYTPRNATVLKEAQGLRPTIGGMKQFDDLVQPLTDGYITGTLGISKTWPWPQIGIADDDAAFLFDETDLYLIIPSTHTPWQVVVPAPHTAMPLVDWWTSGAGSIAGGGGVWQIAFTHGFGFGTNGATTFFRLQTDANFYTQDDLTVTAAGMWKEGRVMLGGFDSGNVTYGGWKAFCESHYAKAPDDIKELIDASDGIGQNWVFLSTIGGGDVFWLFSEHFNTYGSFYESPETDFNEDNPYLFDLWKQNTMAIRPMPWHGKVLAGETLDDAFIIYGEDGLAAMFNYREGKIGMKPIEGLSWGTGLAQRAAIAGDDDMHYFLDPLGDLWRVTLEPGPRVVAQKLGGREIFADMLPNTVIVSKDRHQKEFHIADGEQVWVVTAEGKISQGPKMPTRLSWGHGESPPSTIGILFDPTEYDDAVAKIRTETFTAGPKATGVPELAWLQLVTTDTDATGWTVRVYYRMRHGDSWSVTEDLTPDDRGVVRPKVSGLEWEIEAEHPDRTVCDLEDILADVSDGVPRRRSLRWQLAAA